MSDKVVSLKIKVTDDGSFHTVEVNAEELRDAMRDVQEEIKNLNSELLNWNQAVQAVESVQQSIGQLYSTFSELSAAYAVQETNEAKLANVMKNTMGATDADVEAIKRLCSAQQELGVIGDEVQLAGAQELATYLEERKSLEQLIPVMNDMIAQQYGLEASGESAAQIATMLGKVMQGQTEALSRYGYGFSEVQKEILKTGTEAERAAVLMDVITESVGGTNEALAQTDSGKLQQAANAMGDMKEAAGAMVQPIMKYIAGVNQIGMGVVNLTKLVGSYNAAKKAIQAVTSAQKAHIAAIAAGTLATDKATIADRALIAVRAMLVRVTGSATVSTRALTVATVGLTAALTMGLSAAIAGVVTLITNLCSKSDEAAQKTNIFQAAEEAYKSEAARVKAEMTSEISKLQELIKAKNNTATAVKELNEKYGDIFGTYNTAAEWLDILTNKQESYARQVAYTSKIMQLQRDIADKQVQMDMNKDSMKEMEQNGTAYRKEVNLGTSYSAPGDSKAQTQFSKVETSGYKKLIDDNKELQDEIARTNKEIEKTQAHLDEMKNATGAPTVNNPEKPSPSTTPTPATPTQPEAQRFDGSALIDGAKTYRELGNNVRFYQNALDNTDKSDTAEIRRLVELRDAAKDAQTEIEKLYESFGKQPEAEKSPASIEQLDTEEKLSDALEYYEKKRRKATADERSDISATIAALERKRAAMQATNTLPDMQNQLSQLSGLTGGELHMKLELLGIDDIQEQIKKLKTMLADVENPLGDKDKKTVEDSIEAWDSLQEKVKQYDTQQKKTANNVSNAAGMFSDLGGVMSSVGGVMNDNAAAWLDYGANICNAIAQALPEIARMILGDEAMAKAGAIAQSQKLPPPFNIINMAASLAAVGAAIASIPKFADGGIAYGPTLGIFGEYSGAATNPEVVAPLDKLKSLIGEGGGGMSGDVTFHIHRRELVGVLQSAERYNSRIK